MKEVLNISFEKLEDYKGFQIHKAKNQKLFSIKKFTKDKKNYSVNKQYKTLGGCKRFADRYTLLGDVIN